MFTGKRLQQYLAYAILDQRSAPERKPPVKAKRATPRRGPERDKDYKAWIRTLPCCACGAEERSEAAHTGSDGGMAQKASDLSCVPLCRDCHTQAPGAHHRVGKEIFERRHGLSFAGIVARLNREWQARCA
jgi:hypothetical protein